MSAVTAFLSKLLAKPASWLVQLVVTFLLDYVYRLMLGTYQKYKKEVDRRRNLEERLKKYEDAIAKGASREERRKHAEDVLNSD